MKRLLFNLIPWCIFAIFAADIIAILVPKSDAEFHLKEFGRLPALLNGRVQPFDSVGRNALLQIRSTAAVPLEEVPSWKFWYHAKKLRATEWLLEVMMKPDVADTRPVFLIHHPDLLNELGLRGKGQEKSGLFYFTYNELTNCLDTIEREGRQVMGMESAVRTAYQKQVAKLYNALTLYHRLKNSLQPEPTKDFAADLLAFQESVTPGVAALRARNASQAFDQKALDRLAGYLDQFDRMARLAYPLLVPPEKPDAPRDGWQNMGQALLTAGVSGGEIPAPARWLARMSSALSQNNAAAFNQPLAEYRAWLQTNALAEFKKGRAEFFFNNLQPFLHAMIIYICAFVMAAGAMLSLSVWPGGSEMLRRSAFYITVLAWVVHTAGLIFRMWLENRPPVTNLYSSAIFIGWMAGLLGIVLERIYRVGIGVAASSLVGFVSLVIAHNLALGGDTMEMMRAVLDTNFWLATHVVTITLGYAATFMAGFLAIIYVLVGLFTPLLGMKLNKTGTVAVAAAAVPVMGWAGAAVTAVGLSRDAGKITLSQALGKMVYGIVCFATLFSFVGTVLGGIWADQSWGRFWGWDPKENGALLIVLWNAAILHARWGGWIRERGLMNMAIAGNVVTAWSWFGVNMLGVGLHSYGFMDAAFKWLMIFLASQAALIGLGLLPLRFWSSFRPNGADTPSDPDGSPAPASP